MRRLQKTDNYLQISFCRFICLHSSSFAPRSITRPGKDSSDTTLVAHFLSCPIIVVLLIEALQVLSEKESTHQLCRMLGRYLLSIMIPLRVP